MFTVFALLLVLAGILLIAAVLLQPGKGSGLAGASFGGVTGQVGQMFGVRRASDALQKTTIGLALGILVVTVLVNRVALPDTQTQDQRRLVTQGAQVTPPPAPPVPVQQQPAAPAAGQQAPANAQQAPAGAQQQPAAAPAEQPKTQGK